MAFALAAPAAISATPPDDAPDILIHPWVIPPPGNQAESYLVDLKDGDVRETPFVARFGLSMRGLVPAGHTAGRAGHQHLLIDQPLPLNFKQPLPFTAQYIHFGKGQMETVIDLPPGTYTLRLLLADQGHIPYFVYSKPLTLTVSKQNKGTKPEAVFGAPRVELLNPQAGNRTRAPFRLQFHASGFNISDSAPKIPATGHFRLTLERAGAKPEKLDFANGQTEVWLAPPTGDYTLRLDLVANTGAGQVISSAKPSSVTVISR